MVDLKNGDFLILLWLLFTLFTLLAWMAAAKVFAHVLTGRSSMVAWPAHETGDGANRANASRAENGEHGSRRRAPRRPPTADRQQHRLSAAGAAGHASAEHAHETSGHAGASSPGPANRGNDHRRPDRRPDLWRRWAPRTIRGQMTVLATAMTLLTLLPVGGGMYVLARARTVPRRCDPCATALSHTVGRSPVSGSAVPGSTVPGSAVPGGTVSDVVARGAGGAGRVPRLVMAGSMGSSSAARGTLSRTSAGSPGPLTGAPRPTPTCTAVFPADAFPSALRVVVEAGQSLLGLARPRLPLLVSLETTELIALNAWIAWKVSGRLLRPLDGVSAELSRIDFAHLGAGISVPRSAQEITRLSRTINQALGRVQRAKEELEDVARRQRQFASDVAHELRTPIAGLRVQLEAAQQDPAGVPLPELLETTLVQVDRLETVTDDILCLARLPNCAPAEWRQVDLAALVKAELAQRTDRRPVRLRITHGAIVTAVPSQIGRLLTNLLNNAQRHTRRVVCVEVRVDPAAVEIAVSDDGPGIPEADRERVFQRFTRLDDARRLDSLGTGLGLAIARDIAKAHQGTLSVEESTAGGARFVLRLPRVRQPETG